MIFFRRRKPPLGQAGEDIAAKYLRKQGYEVLQRNAKLGRYEVDIIAREGDTVAFVEVKTRVASDVHSAEDNITPKKERHLVGAAQWYLSKHEEPGVYYRFDVITVTIPEKGRPEVRLYRDAFQAP